MVEVVLISPTLKHTYNWIDVKKISYGNLPIELGYISSYLKQNNHSVKLMDLHLLNRPYKELNKIIKKEKPKFVVISRKSSSFNQLKKISQIVKKNDKKVTVILTGNLPLPVLKKAMIINEIDIAAYGEAEKTILGLSEKKEINKIDGIIYKKNKKIITNPPRKPIKNIDLLPFPDYEGLNVRAAYKIYGAAFFPHRIGITTSRGCPYKCTFCIDPIVQSPPRMRSVTNIIKEIELLYTQYGIKRFEFYDDLFTVHRDRAIKICKEIIKQNFNIKWVVNSRVDTVDEELLAIMKSAGCYYITYGIESGNQEILNMIKKQTSIMQIKNAIKITKKVGLKAYGLFMIGFPSENDRTIRHTINFAKELNLDYATFNILHPIPGTEIFELAKKGQGIKFISDDLGKKAVGYTNMGLPTISKKRLAKYQKRAYKKFYLRPRFLLNKLFFDISFFIINFKKLSSFIRLIKS